MVYNNKEGEIEHLHYYFIKRRVREYNNDAVLTKGGYMKRTHAITMLALMLALGTVVGCSKSEDTSKTVEKAKEEKKEKEEYDQNKVDIALFDHLTEVEVSQSDYDQIKKAYDDTKGLWQLILPNFLTVTHYIEFDAMTICETLPFIPEVESKLAKMSEGVYTRGSLTDTAPFVYMPKALLLESSEYYFGKTLSEADLANLTSAYYPELDGYYANGGVGGYNLYYLPEEFTVKQYKDMYVVIADYADTQGDSGISGTYYLVLEKVEVDGDTHFVYKWAYTHVNE